MCTVKLTLMKPKVKPRILGLILGRNVAGPESPSSDSPPHLQAGGGGAFSRTTQHGRATGLYGSNGHCDFRNMPHSYRSMEHSRAHTHVLHTIQQEFTNTVDKQVVLTTWGHSCLHRWLQVETAPRRSKRAQHYIRPHCFFLSFYVSRWVSQPKAISECGNIR